MSDGSATVDAYIGILEQQCRYLHNPRSWNDFWQHTFPEGRQSGAPMPLILAAFGSSPQKKLERLREQLLAAERLGRLDAALAFLGSLPADHWEVAPGQQWAEPYW